MTSETSPHEIGSLITHDTEATESLARELGSWLQPGDVVVLTGALGAGKTTLTRGLASGIGIVEPITSPTYAIAFVHEHPATGPNLVHVDAYRLSGLDDLETVDLDPRLPTSVTVMEWGAHFVQALTDSWLEVELQRDQESLSRDGNHENEDTRTLTLRAHGSVRPALVRQWQGVVSAR